LLRPAVRLGSHLPTHVVLEPYLISLALCLQTAFRYRTELLRLRSTSFVVKGQATCSRGSGGRHGLHLDSPRCFPCAKPLVGRVSDLFLEPSTNTLVHVKRPLRAWDAARLQLVSESSRAECATGLNLQTRFVGNRWQWEALQFHDAMQPQVSPSVTTAKCK
jgi:hypothetical protein